MRIVWLPRNSSLAQAAQVELPVGRGAEVHRELGQYRVDLLRRGDQRHDHRRVAGVGILHGNTDNHPGVEVARVLGLVSHACPAVLHLRDLRVRVLRMRPVVVRALLRTFPVEAGQLGARRRRDAGRRRQSAKKRVIAFGRVPANDAPQHRVRFQRRRVDADRLPLEQAGVGYPLQHPREVAVGNRVAPVPPLRSVRAR